jgi:hypothetical protein
MTTGWKTLPVASLTSDEPSQTTNFHPAKSSLGSLIDYLGYLTDLGPEAVAAGDAAIA